MTRTVVLLTRLLWVLVVLDTWSAGAHAQTILVRDITIKKVSQAGTLSGCAVNFDVGYQDHTYRQGLPSVVSGGITWYLRPHGAWASLKLVGQDISEAMAPMGHFQITNAFIEVDAATYLSDEQSMCENPQGFCAVYHAEKAMKLMHSAIPTFALGFNRQATGMGQIRLPIVIVEPQLNELSECMDALVGSVTPQQP
jgi:hypothetical protein